MAPARVASHPRAAADLSPVVAQSRSTAADAAALSATEMLEQRDQLTPDTPPSPRVPSLSRSSQPQTPRGDKAAYCPGSRHTARPGSATSARASSDAPSCSHPDSTVNGHARVSSAACAARSIALAAGAESLGGTGGASSRPISGLSGASAHPISGAWGASSHPVSGAGDASGGRDTALPSGGGASAAVASAAAGAVGAVGPGLRSRHERSNGNGVGGSVRGAEAVQVSEIVEVVNVTSAAVPAARLPLPHHLEARSPRNLAASASMPAPATRGARELRGAPEPNTGGEGWPGEGPAREHAPSRGSRRPNTAGGAGLGEGAGQGGRRGSAGGRRSGVGGGGQAKAVQGGRAQGLGHAAVGQHTHSTHAASFHLTSTLRNGDGWRRLRRAATEIGDRRWADGWHRRDRRYL